MSVFGSVEDNQKYSQTLHKLLIYLLKNKENLNQTSLVRPFHLICKLDSQYHNSAMSCNINTKIHPFGQDNYGSFILNGWSYQNGLYPVDFKFNNNTNNLDGTVANPQKLSSIHAGVSKNSITVFAISHPHWYSFSIEPSIYGKYVELTFNHTANLVVSDNIDCFIGTVMVFKALVDSIIRNELVSFDPVAEPDYKKTRKRILKQRQNIQNGQYSWNKIFK